MDCPRCGVPLVRSKEPPYHVWKCSRCEGQAVNVAVLRKEVAESFLQEAWHNAGRAIGRSSRRCPSCHQNLATVNVDDLEIELCRSCQLIWFDAGELDQVPPQSERERADRMWANEIAEQRRRRRRQETWDTIQRRYHLLVSPF